MRYGGLLRGCGAALRFWGRVEQKICGNWRVSLKDFTLYKNYQTMMGLAEQKQALIQEISDIEDEKTLASLAEAYKQIKEREKTGKKSPQVIRQKFDADAIRRRRGKAGHDKEKIMRLIREMDIQEPIENLLAQLSK